MQNRLLVLRHVLTACAGWFLLSRAPVAHAQSPTPAAPVQAIKYGRLLDVRTDRVLPNGVVLVRGRNILPAGAAVMELGNALVLPGLIDAHPHLLQNYQPKLGGGDNMLVTVATRSTARRVLLGTAMGREDLEAGIATVRDLGNSGDVVGPRVVASTRVADRTTIRQALVAKGIDEEICHYMRGTWWTKAIGNWGQVCNGGLGVAALAIVDEEKTKPTPTGPEWRATTAPSTEACALH